MAAQSSRNDTSANLQICFVPKNIMSSVTRGIFDNETVYIDWLLACMQASVKLHVIDVTLVLVNYILFMKMIFLEYSRLNDGMLVDVGDRASRRCPWKTSYLHGQFFVRLIL